MSQQHYTEEYKEQAFYLWYQADRKVGSHKLLSLLPEENGRKPARMVIERWMSEYGWVQRADGLDALVSMGKDEVIIEERRAMHRENVEVAKEMLSKGRKYLQENELQDSQAAIRAITSAVEILKENVGGDAYFQKISNMTDAQIDKELLKLAGKEVKDEFIDEEVDGVVEEDSDTESTELEE